jgi:probable phosphoglycerate mutase
MPSRNRFMPTRVLMLRHAESADPTVFHGAESDVALSPRGHEQAELVATRLAPFAPVAVVSSAMRRALDTAGPIARVCGVAVEVEPLLHERRVGAMSGLLTADRDGPWPRTLQRWLAGETGYALEGAESFDDIRARVLPVWESITRRYEGRTVVVVTHGIVCRVLLVSVVEGLTLADWQRLPTDNVAVNELVRDGEVWRAVRVNDVPR